MGFVGLGLETDIVTMMKKMGGIRAPITMCAAMIVHPREIRIGRRGTDLSALSLRCRYFVVQTLNAGVTFVAAWLAFGLLHIQEEV